MATKKKTDEYAATTFTPSVDLKTDPELKRLQEKKNAAQANLQTASDNLKAYTQKGYTPSESVKAAEANKAKYQNALYNYGEYQNPNGAAMQAALAAITERPAFSFNTDGDALYNRYKNTYQQAANKALENAMGEAAALSGGYGNSYAVTAGMQAANSALSQLDSVIPELYNLALNKYNAEGTELYNRYNALASDDERGYARWQYGRNVAADLADRALADYESEYGRDYGEWGDRGELYKTLYNMAEGMHGVASDNENTAYGRLYSALRDERSDYDADIANQLARDKFNRDIYESDRDFNYNAGQDAISNAISQQKLDQEYNKKKVADVTGGRFDDLSSSDKTYINNIVKNADLTAEEKLEQAQEYLDYLVTNGIIDEATFDNAEADIINKIKQSQSKAGKKTTDFDDVMARKGLYLNNGDLVYGNRTY